MLRHTWVYCARQEWSVIAHFNHGKLYCRKISSHKNYKLQLIQQHTFHQDTGKPTYTHTHTHTQSLKCVCFLLGHGEEEKTHTERTVQRCNRRWKETEYMYEYKEKKHTVAFLMVGTIMKSLAAFLKFSQWTNAATSLINSINTPARTCTHNRTQKLL